MTDVIFNLPLLVWRGSYIGTEKNVKKRKKKDSFHLLIIGTPPPAFMFSFIVQATKGW